MKVVRCLTGHYYDSDKYNVCPYCGSVAEGNAAGRQPEKSVSTDEKGIASAENPFAKNNRNTSGAPSGSIPGTPGNSAIAVDTGTGQTDRVYHNVVFKMPNMQISGEDKNEFPQTVMFQEEQEGTILPERKIFPATDDRENTNAETSVLNGPVMPSIQPNYFRPVSEETTILTSEAAYASMNLEKRAVLYRVSSGEKYYITNDETVIGKVNSTISNDICIENRTVSRRHAAIRRIQKRFFIEDLGSTNKTHINNIDIGSGRLVELKENDRIVLSDEEFLFSLVG